MSTADVIPPADITNAQQPSRESSIAPSSLRPDVAPSTSPGSADASPAPEGALGLDTAQSQSMTVTASNSPKSQLLDAGDSSAAAPYGTRSRNRTGGVRPNYADDKELDMEIEAAGRIPKTTSKRSAANSTANGTPAAESAAAPQPNTVSTTSVQQTNGEQTVQATAASGPGVSTVPAPSKKRKQPGSSTTVSTPSAHTLGPRSRTNHTNAYVGTSMLSFSRCGTRLNAKKQLVADDGTAISANDHAYFVCEPPGEPYYLARIMEFLHVNNDTTAPIDAMRVNWYYRPKDIGRKVQDTRIVFASMHSDTCPLTSLRGKCTIQHVNDIDNLDEYRVRKDSFWFDKLYDRYMQRYYEVVPTSKVVNVPQRVKSVLDERWKFVLIEVGRGRDLTSVSKKCIKCEQFAASHDSVDCAVCKNTYHMRCVRPPLLKKPARGFAWACAACSRAQELRLEARNTPSMSESAHAVEDETVEDEEEEVAQHDHDTRESSAAPEPHPPPTAAQIAQANLWPWRYLGVHSRVEDALDYDDRIYPRASSRLGPRHQANVNVWHGRPVELVKPSEIKKKYLKTAGNKKENKFTKEAVAAIEADREQRSKRPKWVVDEPVGYVPRGQDEPIELKGKKEYTAQLTFKMPDPSKFTERGLDENNLSNSAEDLLDGYMSKVKLLATQYKVENCSTDLLTKAIEKLQENNYDSERALMAMKNLSLRSDLKQPDLNREEIKRFEEGVAKYGSELHAVARHVGGNIKESRIVRFYYMWKKTDNGKQIWGTYEGRRSKKESKRAEQDGTSKLVDDVADDADDSAFDNDKALAKKRGFECKFCATRSSRQWRRAPGTAPGTLIPTDPASKTSKDKSNWLTLALCGRCAYLWRRYAIQYESIEEISKKIAAAGGRASKRRIDEELLRTIFEAQHESGDLISMHLANEVHKSGMEVPANIVQQEEPPKKKIKPDKDTSNSTPEVIPEKKKASQEKQPEAPLEPEPPRVKIHPCAVCRTIDVPGQELLKCRDCRLHVHGSCYGVSPKGTTKPWFCDMCRNDHNLQVSTIYECLLCPVLYTPQELMDPLRVSHKKKTDREREKERLEREMVQEAGRRWRQEQEAAGRPVNPREALKRTAWNNWIHITCALWTKEIKFGNADLLDDAEGIGFIPKERYEPQCKICKSGNGKPTVQCQASGCNATFHVGCAHQAEYVFGFDVALVKGSRRDSVNTMKLDQETGVVTAGIWCPTHTPSTYIHSILEPAENGLTALQLFARTYKQADQSITGTVRRAAQFTANLPVCAPAVRVPQRHGLNVNGVQTVERISGRGLVDSPEGASPQSSDEMQIDSDLSDSRNKQSDRVRHTDGQRRCCTCLVEVSPRWWPTSNNRPDKSATPPTTNGLSHGKRFDYPVANGIQTSGHSIASHPGLSTPTGLPLETTAANGVVKTEPRDYAGVSTVRDLVYETMYQCHKCHVQKRSPPNSPSQIKPRQAQRPEATPGSPFAQPSYPAAAPAPPLPPASLPYQYARAPPDGPPHSHPPAQPVVTQHSPWQGGPPQWSNPVARNGPPPTAPPYPPQPQSNMYRPYDYSNPYPAPPPAQRTYSTIPPPHPPPNGLHQHSPPPPGPYGMPPHQPVHHQHPPPPPASQPLSTTSGRPPSPPPRYDARPPGASPRIGLGSSSYLSRPYPPEPPRQPSHDAPMNGYGPLPTSHHARTYSHPPPPPPPPARPGTAQAQSLAQIAQAATEHVSGSHSRHASIETTPRLNSMAHGARGFDNTSRRPVTPADAPIVREDVRTGPGPASASPSLKNLLS